MVEEQTPQPPVAWRVTRTEDAMVLGRQGLGGRGKRVYFRLLDGTESYVELGISDFTPQKVEQAINEEADRLYQVHSLTGPPVSPGY